MNYVKCMSKSASCSIFIYFTGWVNLLLWHSGQFQIVYVFKNVVIAMFLFSLGFSLTTKCALKCKLKFNPRPEICLKDTWDSAGRVKSKAEVFSFLLDLYPNRWGHKLVWVTYCHLEDKLGGLDLKEAWVFGSLNCLTVGFFLACWPVSFFLFFC